MERTRQGFYVKSVFLFFCFVQLFCKKEISAEINIFYKDNVFEIQREGVTEMTSAAQSRSIGVHCTEYSILVQSLGF